MTALSSMHPGFQRSNARWRARLLEQLPDAIAQELAGELERIEDYRTGNVRLATTNRALRQSRVTLAFDEQKIRDYAENYARLAGRIPQLEQRAAFAQYLGVDPPQLKRDGVTLEGALLRLEDPLWWRRKLRATWTRATENTQRDLGMIRRGRQVYASDEAVRHRAARKARMREFLKAHEMVSEEDERLDLEQLAEHSLSNPVLRRGEFMARLRGFEEYAQKRGHQALFFTLTTPSAFHAQLSAAGGNPRFEHKTIREAQQWLSQTWARVRARLQRQRALVYGFRIAEPHHDGTPHWHGILFVRQQQMGLVRDVIAAAALKTYGDEPGAALHRTDFETVDPAKGSAAGYLAKYVSKNIDGKGAIENERSDESGDTVAAGIERVAAWASTHGIRQFQQIGGPPAGLYREVRRLRSRVEDPDIERARAFADAGRVCKFIECVGGVDVGRRTNLRLERADTGALNRYQEARCAAIVGVRCTSRVELTRPHAWRLAKKCGRFSLSRSGSSSRLGPVAITVRGAAAGGEPAAWTNPNETSQAGPRGRK